MSPWTIIMKMRTKKQNVFVKIVGNSKRIPVDVPVKEVTLDLLCLSAVSHNVSCGLMKLLPKPPRSKEKPAVLFSGFSFNEEMLCFD